MDLFVSYANGLHVGSYNSEVRRVIPGLAIAGLDRWLTTCDSVLGADAVLVVSTSPARVLLLAVGAEGCFSDGIG